MSQEVVTVKGAAGAIVENAKLPDAEAICQVLNEALAVERLKQGEYSTELKLLFQQAFAVASHKRNRQITVHHIAYALAFDRNDPGRKLAQHLKSDVESLAIGCILSILLLGIVEGDAVAPSPSVGALRWIAGGFALARKRGGSAELHPDDLVEAIIQGKLDYSSVLYPIRKSARAGYTHRDQILGVRSTLLAVAPPKDIIEHLDDVAAKGTPSGAAIDQALMEVILEELGEQKAALTSLDGQLSEIRSNIQPVSRMSGNVEAIGRQLEDLRECLKAVDKSVGRLDAIDQQVAGLARRVEPVGELPGRLDKIERRVTAIEQGLPRPPSGLRLAAAIAVVVAIGAAVGLVLTQWQTTSRAADARTVNIEQSR